jgi:hypothetical protein
MEGKPQLMRILSLLIFALMCGAQSLATVTISTLTLPNGTVGTAYSATIAAKNGCTPYAWTLTGALPAGVVWSPSSNTQKVTLSGTPTTAASFSFTAQVKGCGGKISKVSYNLAIQPSAVHVVNLNWNASTSTNVAGYNLYRGADGVNWQLVNPSLIAATLYSDSSVASGSSYYYAATAVDITGLESVKSAPIQVTIP